MRANCPIRSMFPHHLLRAAMLVTLLLPVAAFAIQFGTYRCWSYNVSGGGGSCRLAAPIVVRADGTYQESSTSGTYRIDGNRIYFSRSTIRGPGVISGENQITFEYDYRGWHHTVTYLCQDCSTGSGTNPGAAAPMVWVAVRLNFKSSDGYLGWANSAHLVPAGRAAQFAASSASTPSGGSTGSAYAEDGQTIVANFRGVTGGQDYVVFLDSGRERIAVASVHVPATPAEQTLSVNASLNFTPAIAPSSRSSTAPAAQASAAVPDYPKIGIEVVDVTPEIARAVGNPALRGAGVRSLMPGAPAEKAGVREGDIITEVNGKTVASARELVQALAHRKSGAASHLSVYRDGQTIAIVVP